MGTMDVIVGLIVVGAFFVIIGGKVYNHEKEQIDPIIEKVKGWFSKKDDSSDIEDSGSDPWDHELKFRGQTE